MRGNVQVRFGEGDTPYPKGSTVPTLHEYLFEIAVRQSYLPAALRAALEEDPIVLPAWDPMGSLAGAIGP